MPVDAKLVKQLRDETDAPMMECRAALEEADNDLERAKNILREKGKAAAAKRTDRATAAGVVAIVISDDRKRVGAVTLQSETDFVSGNERFVAAAEELARIFLEHDPGNDPMAVSHGGKTVGDMVQEAVALFRENVQLAQAMHLETGFQFASYVHHDKKKGVIVEVETGNDAGVEAARQVAIQAVAFPPTFVSKDEVPQEKIDAEMEVEVQRAINEGKPREIAENIARGRINKEFMKQVVLLEQPFFKDPAKSVDQFLSEEAKSAGGSIRIVSFRQLSVGA